MSLAKSVAGLLAAIFLVLASVTGGSAQDLEPSAQQKILDVQLRALNEVLSPEMQQALAASQAVWAANRDQQCAFQSKFNESYARSGSSAFAGLASQCVNRMNDQRLQELQGYLTRLMKYQQTLEAQRPAAVENATQPPNQSGDNSVLREGMYLVTGTNPQGGRYSGTCRITALGDNRYRFEWKVGASYVGTGQFKDGSISVEWGSDSPAIYKLNADGSLSGTWASGRGTEFLRPSS
jgi:uncharacterized protein YecT (DUF1311 family)